MLRLPVCLPVLLWISALPGVAYADSADWDAFERLMESGHQAFDAQQYDSAVADFEKAAAAAPCPTALLWLGKTQEAVGRSQDALKAYDEAASLSAENNTPVCAAAGLEAAKEKERLHATLAKVAKPPADEVPPKDVATEPPAKPPEPPWTRPVAIGALGLGVAGLGLGVVAGFVVNDKVGTLEDECGNHTCSAEGIEERDAAQGFATLANVGWIAGSACVLAGVGLLLLEPAPPARAAAPSGATHMPPLRLRPFLTGGLTGGQAGITGTW